MKLVGSPVCIVLLLVLGVVTPSSSAEKHNPEIVVRNAGVPGQNSQEGRERFQRDVLDAHPQVVLIYFGMNDAVNESKKLELDVFLQNIGSMVQTARTAHILPVVSTIQHVDAVRLLQRHAASVYGAEGPNGRIDRYNSALRKLALDQNIALADFNTALDQAGGPTVGISSDGVHLGAAGYSLLATTFLSVIPAKAKIKVIVALGDSLTYGTPLRTSEHSLDQTYPAVLQKLINARAAGHP